MATINASGETVLATAGTAPGSGIYESTYFTAYAPNGRALHGFAAAAANVGASDSCVFVASGVE